MKRNERNYRHSGNREDARLDGYRYEPQRFENGDTKKELLARSRYLPNCRKDTQNNLIGFLLSDYLRKFAKKLS